MSKTAVFCITQTRGQAESIISRLTRSGIEHDDISVLMPETDSNHDIGHVKNTKAPEGTATGAATGGVAGGVFGLLAGIGALAIPGIGAFIAAGPIMAALSGAAIGAATGGIIGGLIGLGIPEVEAKIYDAKLRSGNYLISVHTNDGAEQDQVEEIFESGGGENISTTSEAHVPEPSHK